MHGISEPRLLNSGSRCPIFLCAPAADAAELNAPAAVETQVPAALAAAAGQQALESAPDLRIT